MEDAHKPHRAPHAGAKAERKKAKKPGGQQQKNGNNPKAFITSGSRRAERTARRSTEVTFGKKPVCRVKLTVCVDGREEVACSYGGSNA